MLTKRGIRELSARRNWVVLPVMMAAVGAVFLYHFGMGQFRQPLTSLAADRFGETAGDVMLIALILLAIPVFLVPALIAASYANRFKVICPSCHEDISSRVDRVLATKSCPLCNERIVSDGRAHSAAAYKRYQERQSCSFVRHWLWTWPVLAGLVIMWQWFDQSAFQECPHWLWKAPLLGTALAGWTCLRTFDRRCVPQLLASLGLLGIGIYLFLNP